MNITEIKAAISAKSNFTLGTMSLVRQFNTDEATKVETPTEWVSHWDNDHRVRVTMHQDIMAAIKAEPTKADLAFKYELVPADGARAEYARYIIITPRHIEATF